MKLLIYQRRCRMSRKSLSGLLGIVVGVLWFLLNLRHVSEQGFVAIGMPLIILVLGVIYLQKGKSGLS